MSIFLNHPRIEPIDLGSDSRWSRIFWLGHGVRADALHMQREQATGHWHGFWAMGSTEQPICWQVNASQWPAFNAALRSKGRREFDLHLTSPRGIVALTGYALLDGTSPYLYIPEDALGVAWEALDVVVKDRRAGRAEDAAGRELAEGADHAFCTYGSPVDRDTCSVEAHTEASRHDA